MIQYCDYTALVVEKKTKRKEVCFKPTVHERIRAAADSVGMDESTFIASAAFQKAQEIEASQFVTTLSDDLFDAFAAAVDGPGKRNEALAAVLLRSRTAFVES